MKERNPRVSYGLLSLSLVLALYGSSCAKGGLSAEETSQAIMLQLVDSTVGSINAVLNDAEQASSIQATGVCSTSRFNPAIAGGASCAATANSRTVTATYDCDVSATDAVTISGGATMTFDAAGTCNTWVTAAIPASGTATWTTSSFIRTGSQGQIKTVSALHTNFHGASIGGGSVVTYASGPMSLAINGLRRTGTLSSFSIDHSVHTSLPIAISNPKATHGRPITAGVLLIDDNASKYTATASFNSVRWNTSGCCYPTSGSITYTLAGTVTGTATADFSTGTCGRVSVTGTTGTATSITLQSCE